MSAAKNKFKHVRIAVVGKPNVGKTSLINKITGCNLKVANFSGITISAKEVSCNVGDCIFTFIDLPGTHSLFAGSHESETVCKILKNKFKYDVILNVVDAKHIDKDLHITSELVNNCANKPVIVALNMFDEMHRGNFDIDTAALKKSFGIEFVKTSAKKYRGVEDLVELIRSNRSHDTLTNLNDWSIITDFRYKFAYQPPQTMNAQMEQSLQANANASCNANQSVFNHDGGNRIKNKFAKMIENAKITFKNIQKTLHLCECETNDSSPCSSLGCDEFGCVLTAKELRGDFLPNNSNVLPFIKQISESSVQKTHKSYSVVNGVITKTDIIDKVLLNRVLGLPMFLAIMFGIFVATFKLAEIPCSAIEEMTAATSSAAYNALNGGMLGAMIGYGVISGIGSVLAFMPQIAILFFFISSLEKVGYLARISFIFDDILQVFGMQGKSSIALISGFGCSIPSYMATRIIANRAERIATMFAIGFVPCSAKMTLFVFLTNTFFGDAAPYALIAIYISAIMLSLVASKIAHFFASKTQSEQMDLHIVELPKYRMPDFLSVFKEIYSKCADYLKNAGTFIAVMSFSIWVLSHIPVNILDKQYWEYLTDESEIRIEIYGNIEESNGNPIGQIAPNTQSVLSAPSAPSVPNMPNQSQSKELSGTSISDETNIAVHKSMNNAEKIESWRAMKAKNDYLVSHSVLSVVSKKVAFIFEPLGLEWRLTVSLIAAIAAKEVAISSLSVLYQDYDPASGANLTEIMRNNISISTAAAYIMFLIAFMPCVSATAMFHRELKNKYYTAALIIGTSVGAWVLAFAVKHIVELIL